MICETKDIGGVHMKVSEYMQLIHDGKLQEAEMIRQSTIPDKLIKFVWLDGTESDEKNYCPLKWTRFGFHIRVFLMIHMSLREC